MPGYPSRNVQAIVVLLFASLLVALRDLLNPSALPPEALTWTVFVTLAYLAFMPLCWRDTAWPSLPSASWQR